MPEDPTKRQIEYQLQLREYPFNMNDAKFWVHALESANSPNKGLLKHTEKYLPKPRQTSIS